MLRRARRDERGSVLVIVAVGIPTFIVLAALALDFGSWYAHKREVQNQVDAAAFAAGVAYGYNFPACTTTQAASDNITAAATTYATPPLNGSDATITVSPDPCQPHATGDYSSPAGTIWTDVQAKNTVQSLFGGFGFVPTIRANARVAVMQLQSMTGFRPLAIANPDYTTGECAWAHFENTVNGTVTVPLTLQPNGHWHANQNINVGSDDVPVSATVGDCTNGAQRITYDNVGYIGQYDESAHTEPQFQGLLFSQFSGCDGLYVSRRSPGCTFFMTATIDPGPDIEITSVTADVNGGVTLAGAGNIWQGTVPASQLFAGAGDPDLLSNGVIPINIEVTYHRTVAPNAGVDQTISFSHVQQVMAGDDRHEGPITDFTLSQNEVNKNNTIFNEQIDLVLEPISGPTTVLRARGGSNGEHTLNGTVNCADGQPSIAAQITNGCTTSFQVHTQSLCSGPPANPPDCIAGVAGPGSLTSTYNALWAGPGSDCSNAASQNHWANYPNIPRGDPRLITVPVTRIGNPFSPGDNHPVISFAAFYVTGWRGMNGGCGDPAPPATANFGSDDNAVWGHFIRFVEPSSVGAPKSTGVAANDQCDPNSTDIAACIATLVQ